MSNAVCYSLYAACLYLTLYRLAVLFHSVQCCLLRSLGSQSLTHTVPSVGSLTLYPLLYSTVSTLSLSTSHCNVGSICVTVSAVFLYSLSTVSAVYLYSLSAVFLYTLSTVYQYCILYPPFALFHCVHCCILHSVHFISAHHNIRLLVLCHYVHQCLLLCLSCVFGPHIVTSVCSWSLCPLLSSAVCPLCQYLILYCLFFPVTIPTAVF